MALSRAQVTLLSQAMTAYAFPAEYFDFGRNTARRFATMSALEPLVRADLISGSPSRVKDGLSNVLYWGFAQMGIRDFRVNRFRTRVSRTHIDAFIDLLATSKQRRPFLADIAGLKLPEFSGVSFTSKIRMFLDPKISATLDWQILKINDHNRNTVLSGIRTSHQGKQIPTTHHNSGIYEKWCERLAQISSRYFGGRKRVADLERGFFQLIQSGKARAAANILRDA